MSKLSGQALPAQSQVGQHLFFAGATSVQWGLGFGGHWITLSAGGAGTMRPTQYLSIILVQKVHMTYGSYRAQVIDNMNYLHVI